MRKSKHIQQTDMLNKLTIAKNKQINKEPNISKQGETNERVNKTENMQTVISLNEEFIFPQIVGLCLKLGSKVLRQKVTMTLTD